VATSPASLILDTQVDNKQLKREPLAVIGIGCRLPGDIDSPPSFWSALLRGMDAIRDVPEDRWNHARFHDTNPEKSGCIRNAKGGFINGVDQFDGDFFGYFPAAAQRIDPQQRLLLEVTHEAMEDAGLRRDQLDRSRTAVFIGSFMYDYLCMQSASEQRDEISSHAAMGTAICSLANRISYDFNLTGPSITLDTACSASLTALHLACQSVWRGEAEMAIAGGVNLMLRPETSIMLSKGGFLNPDQFCKAFDESANGYVRGEGAGVVILKPLSKALADGDAIYACVLGSAVNQDGYLPDGFTVPNVRSQIDLLKTVYQEAGVDPATVDFVEAHGTGTPVGDPVETAALGSVLGYDRGSDQPNLLIGSVKTNLGHLEGASGITGFIKGVLTAQHGVAPPNLHFHEPNPEIPWELYRLQVPTEPTPLNSGNRPITVGVNSFGAGGANAHVILRALAKSDAHRQRPVTQKRQTSAGTLYAISASNRESLRMLAIRHADYLNNTQNSLEDVAYSAFTRRSHYPQLLAVVGENTQEVQARLRAFADGQVDPENLTANIAHSERAQVAFVFSGQGGQWAGMGLQLMQREPVFRDSMEEIDALFMELAGWSLLEELRKEKATSRLNDTVIVQPAIMAIQISLVKLYEHYGIRPSGVVGHSIGEVAAGYAAGALTLEQAVQVIYQRSQAQNLAAGKGGMLAVGLSLKDARQLIEGREGVSIGAVNGPEILTLSGDPAPLQQIAQLLEKRGIFNREVKVEVAYHSHHMDPIQDIMLESLAGLQGAPATIPLYSTVTGAEADGTHLNADYWFQNVRQPVLFTDAMSSMVRDAFNTFVEIGPHPVLVRGGEALIQKANTDAIMAASMTRKEPEVTVFLQSLAILSARGAQPDVEVLFGADRRYVRLPKNPWQHNSYWFEAPAAAELRRGPFEHPFLKHRKQMVSEDGLAVWDAALSVQKFPYLRDHQVDGEIVFPATGHLELAWAVASEQFRHESFFLENLHFDLPLIIPDSSRHPLDVHLEIVSGEGDYRICSRPADATAETRWTKHSSGRINKAHDRFEKSNLAFDEVKQRFQEEEQLSVETFYETLDMAGMAYGENFRCIQQLQHHELPSRQHEWLAQLHLPEELTHEAARISVHPALLDACLHVVFADVHRLGHPDRIFLPHRIGRVRFHSRPTQNVWARVLITRNDEEYLCSDTLIYNEVGELVAEVLGLEGKRLAGAGSQQTDSVYEGCYEYRWTPSPHNVDLHGRNFDYATAVLVVPQRQATEETKLVAEVAERLSHAGVKPQIFPIGPDDSYDELMADVPLDRRTLIVFLAGLSSSHAHWQQLSDCPSVPSLLHLAQMLHKREGVPRLCLVTNGASDVAGDQQLDLGQAILHGMSRVINNECPSVPLTMIDLSAVITPCEIEALIGDLLHNRRDQDETEIAIRGEQRYIRQLFPIDRESAELAAVSQEAGFGGSYRADLHDPGMLDHIVFRGLPHQVLKENEVEISVRAAGLSFKDIMNAMGLLPENAIAGGLTGRRLGLEVSGRVLRTGAQVKHVQPGDEVIARVPEGFCGRVTTQGHYVVLRPATLTPVQAAAIPLAYVTAWYSLCHLARVARGETVLIHSAAGGIGSAAIQLAQRAGATVIASAGTKEKREYLKQMGVQHVFDSRSLDFYNLVEEFTEGRGVDIVLNFLHGPFLTQSMKCLAPFGRFLEFGKSDIYRNGKLNLERLGENISYHVVDIDRLAAQKPALHQQFMTEVLALFESGELRPLEITEFPVSKLHEAFKYMTRMVHQGKIVINMENDQVQTHPPRNISFRAERSYLISGGAGGFGLEIARWMVDRGARHLVLLSRSGLKNDADRAAVEAMRSQGVSVSLPQADVTNREAIASLVQEIQSESQPLAGVIHAAAVMDDATIPNIDMQRFERVFQPKAQGAWNLHEATLNAAADLDFFVMLSSISSAFGFVGQVNYAAANYFQDALAQFRRQQNLPGTAVNLGVLGQYAGLSRTVNENQDVIGLLESFGMYAMPLNDILNKFETALIHQPAQRVTARVDWPWFRTAYPHLARDARFIELMGDAALARAFRPKGTGLRTELAELEPNERVERVQAELQGKLALILDAAPEKLDVSASIDNLGLDSLMLTELQIWIGRLLNVTVPLIKLLKGPSITTLAMELLAELDNTDDDDAAIEGQSQETFTLADLDDVQVLNPWLIRGSSSPEAPCRLICFHSMGVGASLFTKFLLNPPDNYDILAVQTPGRENRIDEPVAEHFDQLLDHIVPLLQPLFDRPVVIWGHSFGGVVALEVIRRLRDEHQLEPNHLVVTGTAAPHLMHHWQNREVLLKALIEDNSPEYLMSLSRFVDDPEFIKAILPGMRRDFPLLKNYRFQPKPPLSCPITAFAARQDDMVYTDEIREWFQHTDAGFELIEVDGDHWFLDRNRELIIANFHELAAKFLHGDVHLIK
jgi:acyl transferase domain-containing protein/surfactin synthase thioesterase subunit